MAACMRAAYHAASAENRAPRCLAMADMGTGPLLRQHDAVAATARAVRWGVRGMRGLGGCFCQATSRAARLVRQCAAPHCQSTPGRCPGSRAAWMQERPLKHN